MNSNPCVQYIIVVLLALALSAHCIDMNTSNSLVSQKALNYTDCTPGRNCLSCSNEYICNKCASQQKCCPKRCISCNNDTTCSECEPGFQLASDSQKGWTFCANSDIYNNIDYHRIQITNMQISNPNQYYSSTPTVSTKCEKGYYYETNIKFCEKCIVKNCSLCQDSIHCLICESGYLLFNGLCLTFDDIKAAFGPVEIPQPTEQDGYFFIFVTIIGMVIGCSLVCILIILYSCIKGCCLRCFYRFFPPDNSSDFVEEEITKQPNSERRQKMNKTNKISQNSQMSERFDSQSISNAAMTEQNITN